MPQHLPLPLLLILLLLLPSTPLSLSLSLSCTLYSARHAAWLDDDTAASGLRACLRTTALRSQPGMRYAMLLNAMAAAMCRLPMLSLSA